MIARVLFGDSEVDVKITYTCLFKVERIHYIEDDKCNFDKNVNF